MRKPDHQQPKLFYSLCPESLIPEDHPLRYIKRMVQQGLKSLNEKFTRMYSSYGRPGILPERLLKALLLQILFTIRSERALMEHIKFNLLYRWFVGLDLQDPVWDSSTFSKNCDRLIEADISLEFLRKVLDNPPAIARLPRASRRPTGLARPIPLITLSSVVMRLAASSTDSSFL